MGHVCSSQYRSVLSAVIGVLLSSGAVYGQLSYRTSWAGNTFGGPSKWVQSNVQSMYVSPDGHVFTDSYWDESGREAGVYKDGDAVANPGYTHGWGNFGGKAVAANTNYLYIGARMDSQGGTLVDPNTWPPQGTYWYGISRRQVSTPGAGAPFSGGKGGSGGTLYSSFLIVSTVAEGTDAAISGMFANDSRLFVSNAYNNEVRIYDASSMAFLGSFPVTNPGPLVLDGNGTLWIVQMATSTSGPKVVHYTTAGAQLPDQITAAANPTALAIDNQGRLLVADAGPSQQILTFSISSGPVQVASFAVPGGMPVGVGSDVNGSLYVCLGVAGVDIRKYSSGSLIWRVLGLVFDETAVADASTDGADVYTQSEHYAMDYTQSNGQEWSYRAPTIDPLHYPTDPRLAFPNERISPVQVRTIQGRKYLFMGATQHCAIYRFQGETAVPSVMFAVKDLSSAVPGFQPPSGHWMWRDLNGDGNIQNNEFLDADGGYDFDVWGWEMDRNGDIWRVGESSGLYKFPLQGVDGYGNLIYSRATAIPFGTIAPFTQMERARYFADTDTMYISGYTVANPKTGTEWGGAGREVARYDNWSTGNRNPRWRVVLPYPDPNNYGFVKSWAVAGQRLFAGMLNSQGLAETSNAHNLYVYDTGAGAALGEILPGPEIGQSIGWLDITDALSAYQRSTGEYVVLMEEVAWEKVVLYRVAGGSVAPPVAAVTSPSSGSTVTGSATLAATASSSIGIASVQFQIDGVNVGAPIAASPYTLAWNSATVSNGSHSATAVARDTAGTAVTSSAVSFNVNNGTQSGSASAYRFNVGGPAYTDPATGQGWSADQNYSGGYGYSSGAAISGTSTPALYQTQRYGSAFQYQFNVAPGSYSVKLKFAELYFSSTGQRVFNAVINGQSALTNFDIVAQAGGMNVAVDRVFPVSAPGGQITIAFSSVVNNAALNAIDIEPATSGISVSVSPTSANLTAGQSQQFSASVSGSTNTAVTWSLSPAVGAITSTGLYTAPASVTASQSVTVIATSAADGVTSGSATVALNPTTQTPAPPPSGSAIRVNAGGNAYTDPQGQVWSADTGYSGATFTYSTTQSISGTAAPALYQSERYGSSFQYQFSVPNGTYAVTLKFAELYWNAPGQRIFNVAINGQPVLTNFDIVAQAGGAGIALDRTFVTAVAGGQVTIAFNAVVDKAKIGAIAILPATSILRVNAGGPAYTDPSGRVWSADTGFSGGNLYATSSAISGTLTQPLYQSERYGSALQYQFSAPNGNVIVVLKFAEDYWWASGQRIFNAAINGAAVLSNFDVFAQAGGQNIAIDRAFPVAISNGLVTINMTAIVDQAKINAIEILTTP